MTLPSATQLQMKSRQITTAEMLAYAASRHNKWFPSHAAPRAKEEATAPRRVTRIVQAAPAPRVWTGQHDSHVHAFLEWKGNEPVGFLKLRCRELDLDYSLIVGTSRKRNDVRRRGELISEMKARFPEMTLPALGRIFGGRDHTTILHFLRKHGGISRRCSPSVQWRDKVDELFHQGLLLRDIAQAIGRSQATVCLIIKENGWTRGVHRRVEDHVDTIREMYMAGAYSKDIAPVIGYSRSHVSEFIKRQGWKR
jgi:hypothetical protein